MLKALCRPDRDPVPCTSIQEQQMGLAPPIAPKISPFASGGNPKTRPTIPRDLTWLSRRQVGHAETPEIDLGSTNHRIGPIFSCGVLVITPVGACCCLTGLASPALPIWDIPFPTTPRSSSAQSQPDSPASQNGSWLSRPWRVTRHAMGPLGIGPWSRSLLSKNPGRIPGSGARALRQAP